MYAELPYLAKWLVGQLRRGKSLGHQDAIRSAAQSLASVIQGLHELAAGLDRNPAQAAENAPALRQLWDNLLEAHAEYTRILGEETAADEQQLREIIDVLTVPSMDIRWRDALMRTLIDRLHAPWTGQLSGSGRAAADGARRRPRMTERSGNRLGTLDQAGRHPSLQILDRSQFRLLPALESAAHAPCGRVAVAGCTGRTAEASAGRLLRRRAGPGKGHAKRARRGHRSGTAAGCPAGIERGRSADTRRGSLGRDDAAGRGSGGRGRAAPATAGPPLSTAVALPANPG